MRLDHVSYVASHDQISDVVNRIGSQIRTAFVDGGIHPKFGTRNFTAPLLNGQYIEVVCPLDHPAVDHTPFGRIVKSKVDEGGGWMSWALSVDNIIILEKLFKRSAVAGTRKKPDGTLLKWKQIGILDSIEKPEFPYYVEWQSSIHPSHSPFAVARITSLNLQGDQENLIKTIQEHGINPSVLPISFSKIGLIEGTTGLMSVDFTINDKKITII
jgi:hypothetical protein